jgi:hypothetical protein
MTPKTLLTTLTTLAVVAAVPTGAMAAKNPTADAAMKKGIKDYARVAVTDTKASNIKIDCQPVTKVGQKGACVGMFSLTKGGKTAHYKLTSKARTLRLSPGAIEYRVSAVTKDKVKGLPASTGSFSGFLQ